MEAVGGEIKIRKQNKPISGWEEFTRPKNIEKEKL